MDGLIMSLHLHTYSNGIGHIPPSENKFLSVLTVSIQKTGADKKNIFNVDLLNKKIKSKMKKFLYVAAGLAIIIAAACRKNNIDVEKPLIPGGANLDTLKGTISANTIVSKDVYLYGLVYVSPGVTLTINPGVKVYGSQSTIDVPGRIFDSVNTFKNKGILCIQAGARLIAQGTPSQPIIWTSDNKIPVGQRKFGDWGGLIIYGNAPIHKATTGAANGRFEAFDIVPNDLRNFYGGSNAADNSGILTYNRLEFGGGLVTEVDKEINGLTLAGVGSGTTINHLEVIRAGDDGIEWFGGTVNADHLLSYGNKDDDFDFDEGYSGRLQFILAVRDTLADNSGSHLIEADNDASGATTSLTPYTAPFIANATLIGPQVAKNFAASPSSYFDGAVLLRRRVSVKLANSYVIANKMPFGLVFTPTTGVTGTAGGFPTASLLDPPALTLPGNVQYNNIFQINNDANFAGAVVLAGNENNPIKNLTGSPSSSTVLAPWSANDAGLTAKIISANNLNNGLVNQSDFSLGDCLENRSSTPFLTGGVDLSSFGFVATNERGAVTTGDNWTCAGVTSGWISITLQ